MDAYPIPRMDQMLEKVEKSLMLPEHSPFRSNTAA